jgi:hypothetical protein
VFFWAYLAPIAATPVTGGGFSGRVTITPMPSSEATPAVWIALLDSHLGVAIADSLALTSLAGSYHKLLALSRCTPWAVTW